MDIEIATALLKSGVVTEIFKQVCALVGVGYDKLEAKIANAWHKYDEKYRDRHGHLKVFCVKMRNSIPLDDVYVAVQFLDHHTSSRYRSLEDVEQTFREREWRLFSSSSDERQDGIQVANENQYLMLLGGPGVGKSTFLRKVGLEALNGKNGDFKHKCIPVFLELKRFREDQIDIEALIAREFEICSFPYPEQMTNAALTSGKLLILFDGLDEVPKENVHNVIDKIGDFVDQYSQNRFIASCRRAAYSRGFGRFTEVDMADFDDPQIEMYINNWFASASHRKMKTAERCSQALNDPEHQATKVLAQNPLSLALLCQVYEDLQDFPSSQAILYEKIIGIFLKKWTAEKGVRRDPPMSRYLAIPTVKELLSEIAAENFKADRLVFSEDELIDQIQEFYQQRTDISSGFDASGILDAILVDPGLFVERANGIYSFFHLTFQEYLTANHLVSTRSIQDLVSNHLHDEQWSEVFLLTSGLMDEADDLLLAMEAEAAKLIDTPGLKTLFRWAEGITDTTDYRYDGSTKRAFAICQHLSLRLLSEIYDMVEQSVNRDRHLGLHQNLYRHLNRYLNFCLNPDLNRYLNRHLIFYIDEYQDIHRYLIFYIHRYTYLHPGRYGDLDKYLNFYRSLNPDISRDEDSYIDPTIGLNPGLSLHQDFYRYIDADFYPLFSAAFGDRFDEELQERITLAKDIEEMKIFKEVDLQRMVQRFNEQREYIKAAYEGKFVEPPAESIHDAWLSVLGITGSMLEISDEDMGNYIQYLRAIDLIIACKEAAGRLSPDVWQQIEDRFLTVDAADIEN